MKKDCEDLFLDLSAYVDGELMVKSRIEIENHLKSCKGCRQLVQELEETGDLLKATLEPGSEPGVDLDGVWQEIEGQFGAGVTIGQKVRSLFGKPKIWIPAAAATFASALLIFIFSVAREPARLEMSRVESVYSQTGQVMVMQTASSGQPLIWILPQIGKEASQ